MERRRKREREIGGGGGRESWRESIQHVKKTKKLEIDMKFSKEI